MNWLDIQQDPRGGQRSTGRGPGRRPGATDHAKKAIRHDALIREQTGLRQTLDHGSLLRIRENQRLLYHLAHLFQVSLPEEDSNTRGLKPLQKSVQS